MIRLHLFAYLLFISSILFGQYTDQINSNRPGASIGAFSVGTRVIQFEAGTEYRTYKHKGYNNSTINGKIGFFALRYGFLKEQLELTYEAAYQLDQLINKTIVTDFKDKRGGFLNHYVGLKYLIYDPFRKERKVDARSWKANNGFKLRDLIPAVSITLGANVALEEDNPYRYGDVFSQLKRPVFYQNFGVFPESDPFISGRATLATQSHFLGSWVFVTNVMFNRIISTYPEINYILTLTHTINPLWSVYMETQGFSSDIYTDQIFRTGAAYLFSNDIQLEATVGVNTKDTPSLFFINAGVSYRLDFHKDINPEKKAEEKALKKEEKGIRKGAKKAEKANRKRDRKAKRN